MKNLFETDKIDSNIEVDLKKLILTLLIILSFSPCASTFIDQGLEKDISDAELIIFGELQSKTVNKEDISRQLIRINENGELESYVLKDKGLIVTTFIFAVNEIIKGSYEKELMKVKMIGGCIDHECHNLSSGYEFNLKEKGLLFLEYAPEYNSYFSINASHTVFSFNPDNELFSRKSKGFYSSINNEIIKSSDAPVKLSTIKKIVNDN